jgi:hypothetical protein
MVCKTTPSTMQKSDKKWNPLLNVKTLLFCFVIIILSYFKTSIFCLILLVLNGNALTNLMEMKINIINVYTLKYIYIQKSPYWFDIRYWKSLSVRQKFCHDMAIMLIDAYNIKNGRCDWIFLLSTVRSLYF